MKRLEQEIRESNCERLERLRPVIDAEIGRVKKVISEKKEYEIDSEDFDLRGELYRLAFEVAPEARGQDLAYMKTWIEPQPGEVSIDVAAGTGFLTIPLAAWTNGETFAIDPSEVQLNNLNKKKGELNIKTIVGSLSERQALIALRENYGKIDLVTSYGGLHHVIDKNGVNRQKKLFENISKLLKGGGRVVVGDVGKDTTLARHFEISVKGHCLTGHKEKWLDVEKLQGELIDGTDLEYIKSEIITVEWIFENETQLALFMKCLHAYDMTDEEILNDLQLFLGYEMDEKSGQCRLNWPMFFFHLQKL